MIEIFYTARFLRSLGKLETSIQEDVLTALDKFPKKNNHQQLKLHKLEGKMKQYYAFSVNYKYRVVVKMEKNIAYCMDVGTHDIYK